MTTLLLQIQELGWQLMVVLSRLEVMAPSLGAAVGLCVGIAIHWYQTKKARVLPYLPSYREAVTQEHDAATRFFSAVHDLTMCVTEAWNMTKSRRRNAGSVELHLSQEALQRACRGVKTHGQTMMDGFVDYQELSNLICTAHAQLDSAWSYTSQDNYRTEYYTETSVDSDGDTVTETKSRQVYEDTDHWFTFDASLAHTAHQTMRTLAGRRVHARLRPPDLQRMRVAVGNLSQADRMFLEKLYIHTVAEDPEAKPTEAELEGAVNQWLLGTRIDQDLHQFEAHMDEALSSSEVELEAIHASESTYHFNTGSRSHEGPPGYQAAQRLQGILDDASSRWTSVAAMWETCSSAAETLLQWATDDSEIESDRRYAKTAIEAYEAAFPDSTLDVNQLTSPGATFLISLVLAVVVALAVVLLHPSGPLF